MSKGPVRLVVAAFPVHPASVIVPATATGRSPKFENPHSFSAFPSAETLETARPGKCPFLTGIERLYLPMAHGEGNFVCRAPWILKGLEQAGQIVLRYVDAEGKAGPYPVNPNGSQDDVAGLCDVTGRVLGIMPHPERHVLPTHHPRWTRLGLAAEGEGLKVFRNAVAFFG